MIRIRLVERVTDLLGQLELSQLLGVTRLEDGVEVGVDHGVSLELLDDAPIHPGGCRASDLDSQSA